MLLWQPFVFSVSHHFLGWKNEEIWIIFKIMAWSCSNLVEAFSGSGYKFFKTFYVWHHYDVKMARHQNACFPFGRFLAFCCSFWFFVPKKPKQALQCSNGNINKKPKRATKSENKQSKAFACFGFWDRASNKNKSLQANSTFISFQPAE